MKKKIWVLTGVFILILGLGTSFFYADAFKGSEESKNKATAKKQLNDLPENPESEGTTSRYFPSSLLCHVHYDHRIDKREVRLAMPRQTR